jgi:hypothetical protein
MSERALTVLRWLIVAGYTFVAWGLEHDGVTESELAALFVSGAVLIVVILSLGWIANGRRV